jgi:hypothetical protein
MDDEQRSISLREAKTVSEDCKLIQAGSVINIIIFNFLP